MAKLDSQVQKVAKVRHFATLEGIGETGSHRMLFMLWAFARRRPAHGTGLVGGHAASDETAGSGAV